MRAILLAAGLGTRLRPITDTIPKCLVPIKGRPLLQIWLERLSEVQVGPFLVNTHYLSEQVHSFIDSGPFQERVIISYEDKLLGTAGTLLQNLDFFEGNDGLLIHADNYCLADLKAFINAHQNRPSGCVMTMMTFRTNDPSSCGIVELDGRGVVKAFYEKIASPPGNLANGAVYILSAELLEQLKGSTLTDFSTEILHRFVGRIYTYETFEIFMDIGTPEAYAMSNL